MGRKDEGEGKGGPGGQVKGAGPQAEEKFTLEEAVEDLTHIANDIWAVSKILDMDEGDSTGDLARARAKMAFVCLDRLMDDVHEVGVKIQTDILGVKLG